MEAYALDLVGWGLTTPKQGVSIEAKRQQIEEFVRDVVKGPASSRARRWARRSSSTRAAERSGGERRESSVDRPQCFIDGAPPVPEWGARLGVRVLARLAAAGPRERHRVQGQKVGQLRRDPRPGLLHCERDAWEDDAVAWLLGGGYSVSDIVAPALRGRGHA